MYDDAVDLQQYFVIQRDKLCKDGERFVSPALVIIKRHLLQELDEERKAKTEAESKEDEKQKELERREGKQQLQASYNKLFNVLTGWESFHLKNNSFGEHNTLFSANRRPCSFYTHTMAHAEYR